MIVLAVDTTARTSAVALTDGKHLLASSTLNTPSTHSVTVLPMIDAMLAASELSTDDIDMFACSVGPGSFTGVRIGVSLIKGMAFSSEKPCVGVSALEALAHNMISTDCIVCPVMDARRSQLYNALFSCENGKLTRLTEDRLITSAELGDELVQYSDAGQKIYFVGEGYSIAARDIKLPNVRIAPEHCLWQNGYSVAVTALNKYETALASGIENSDFSSAALSPVYLRASQAERERELRNAAKDVH